MNTPLEAYFRAKDPGVLARLLMRSNKYLQPIKALTELDGHQEHLLLTAPASLALAIRRSGFTADIGQHLRVIVNNPGTIETLDHGQWFRYVVPMLGIKTLTIYMCGKYESRQSVAKQTLRDDQRIRVIDRRSVSDALRRLPKGQTIDFAVQFSPFESNDSMQSDLVDLGRNNVPFILLCQSRLLSLMAQLVAEKMGARFEEDEAVNPFALVEHSEGLAPNKWILRSSSLPTTMSPLEDEDRNVLYLVEKAIMATHSRNRDARPEEIGLELQMGVVHTMGGYSVDLDTLGVRDLDTGSFIGVLPEQYADVLNTYEKSWTPTEKLYWSGVVRSVISNEEIAPLVA
ncbi:MAG: hypothetical protein GKR90_25670 [Pseudomonadales bacterium]|nr:hypothetical protein [Pseudomonadales bacterium]